MSKKKLKKRIKKRIKTLNADLKNLKLWMESENFNLYQKMISALDGVREELKSEIIKVCAHTKGWDYRMHNEPGRKYTKICTACGFTKELSEKRYFKKSGLEIDLDNESGN